MAAGDDIIKAIHNLNIPTRNYGGISVDPDRLIGDYANSGWGLENLRGFNLNGVNLADFFTLLGDAETFAANTGYQHFPPVQTLRQMALNGWANSDIVAIMHTFGATTGTLDSMPWAMAGMDQTTYDKTINNLNSTLYSLTGKNSWAAAGLDPYNLPFAANQGWSSDQIKKMILNDPNLSQQYGYLRHVSGYQEFQDYKTTNADKLRQRYGNGYNDTMAISSMDNPLTAFNAAGGAMSVAQEYQNQAPAIRGSQTAVR